MLGTPEQQKQQIAQLSQIVNILSGEVAALMAYVAAVTTPLDPSRRAQVQGQAEQIAPIGFPMRTSPKLAASQGIDQILWLAEKLQTPPPR
jgi:hypothetical protein